ncbi:NUDIX domain-containing protein [Allostreptomyces psammosilenae]|uniref:ADP-ribose pyrophosphatase YjhB (NUDIX family) n=1 Tax=Allostreptomyces psammosilenae TaxID=1892865 RepID=A0A852ZPB3_9ACTN|nr:NUDIX hydrolase [Allostreptomyces psammosilenae]NYI04199.1 ADP-ribose pyrophosphatase YjhB (NUDIX family) [Allostreptomyces psammosilenae]
MHHRHQGDQLPPASPVQPADPELVAWFAEQPGPLAGVDAVVQDERGRLLVVDPVYKPGWDLPGGLMDSTELPVEALRRELAEELGIEPAVGRLLVVDAVPASVFGRTVLTYLYHVGPLTPEQLGELRLVDGELRAALFLPVEEALALLPDELRRRTAAALASLGSGTVAHLHHGRPFPGTREALQLWPGEQPGA